MKRGVSREIDALQAYKQHAYNDLYYRIHSTPTEQVRNCIERDVHNIWLLTKKIRELQQR